jgi:hypothetical protein
VRLSCAIPGDAIAIPGVVPFPALPGQILADHNSGCYATLDPQPVGYTVVSAAPVDIETYPSVMYSGQPVYFYGDRWWYRDGERWTYYQTEPEELRGQRAVVVRMPRTRGRARVTAPHAEVREGPREEHQEEHREHR